MCAGSCCCRGTKEITGKQAKTFYFLFFLVGSLVAFALSQIGHVPGAVNFFSFKTGCANSGTLETCFGIQGIFRISFGLFLFFSVMTLLSWSKMLFLGMWGVKAIVWIIFTAVVFFFQYSTVEGFAKFAEGVSFFYLVIQVLILLELSYRLQGFMMAKIDERDKVLQAEYAKVGVFQNCWKWLYILLCLSLQVLSLALVGWLVHSADKGCKDVRAFAAVTIVAGLVHTLMCVLNRFGNKGLLPASCMFAYTAWLCFTAVANTPQAQCRPPHVDVGARWSGIAVGLLSLGYCSVVSDSGIPGLFSFKATEVAATEREALLTAQDGADAEEAREAGEPKEEQAASTPAAVTAPVRYWSFTLVMLVASAYMAMLLADWRVSSNTVVGQTSSNAMFIIMASQWVAIALFLWSLIAPALFPDRDFD